jgi:hypothetical protein
MRVQASIVALTVTLLGNHELSAQEVNAQAFGSPTASAPYAGPAIDPNSGLPVGTGYYQAPVAQAQPPWANVPVVEMPPAPVSGGPQSPGLIVLGSFMSLAGAGGLIAGGYLFGQDTAACDALLAAAEAASAADSAADSASSIPSDADIAACQGEVNQKVGGTIAMISGGAFLLAGLPLLIVGATPEDPSPAVSFTVTTTSAALEVKF